MRALFKKEKIPTKIYSFPAFSFVSHVNVDTMARGNSHERGSASTVLNSPHIAKSNFKKQEWMSDGYLDSILSLPLRAHTDKGLTGFNAATCQQYYNDNYSLSLSVLQGGTRSGKGIWVVCRW